MFRYWLTCQFSSVAQSCPILCNPMNCSTPGLPVHHQLPESTQTHVHRVGDAIQPSHPLLSPSPPALNPSQHQQLHPNKKIYESNSFSFVHRISLIEVPLHASNNHIFFLYTQGFLKGSFSKVFITIYTLLCYN